MRKEQTFSSKVKGGKKEKYSRNSARKLYLSVLYDLPTLLPGLGVEKVWGAEKKNLAMRNKLEDKA